jgi:branched-chain amino acid transport system substrate-binding protein
MRAYPLNALPVVLASLLGTGIPVFAEDGVSADKIVFGQATALDGPASALGQGMKMGLEAAFAEVNKAGGVKGRKLELKSIDDGYEPTKSIEAVKKLLEEDKVFAIAGAVGTPTSAATQPIATAVGAPFIGAFTGAEFLREPYKPLVMNIRASYFQETEAMVEHLTKDLGASKIAIMYQDDAFGQAGLAGVKRALEKRQIQLAGEGTFERNTVAVKAALLAIKKVEPQAVIMISPYKPAAEFIKLAKQIKFDATFVNISFVGSDALAKELGPVGAGVVITQVVPFPKDAAIPVVGRYQASLKASVPDAQPGFVSLEGYLVGRAIIAALEKVNGEPTRKALIEAVQKAGTIDLGNSPTATPATAARITCSSP